MVWDWAIEMGCIIRWGGQNRPDRDGCIGVNRTTGTICVKAVGPHLGYPRNSKEVSLVQSDQRRGW